MTAAGSAGVGAKVAIIEKNLMGGDCLNVGCVPSKSLLKCAKVANTVRFSFPTGAVIFSPTNPPCRWPKRPSLEFASRARSLSTFRLLWLDYADSEPTSPRYVMLDAQYLRPDINIPPE